MYEERFYRSFTPLESKLQVSYKESDLYIWTDKKLDKDFLFALLKKYYHIVEDYIKKNPLFLSSLSSLPVDEEAPSIIKEMLYYSQKAKLGPFSTVAGAIAEYLGREILNLGLAQEVIVENGGDIFLKINKDKRLGVYLGERFLKGANLKPNDILTLKIRKRASCFGIASSSGIIGHSLNFGNADLVSVVASNAIMADAFATCLSNLLKKQGDTQEVFVLAKEVGLEGVLVAFGDKLYLWGDLQLDF